MSNEPVTKYILCCRGTYFALMCTLTFMLSGCVNYTTTTGTVVHTLPAGVLGQTFYVLTATNTGTSAEHSLYRNDVVAVLKAKGMTEAAESNADYWVKITFGINSGEKYTRGSTDAGVKCESESDCEALRKISLLNNVDVRIVSGKDYRRFFTMTFIDRAATLRANNAPQVVYEAKASSEGSQDSFMSVSKCIILAVVKDFPGKSGRTIEVDSNDDNCIR
jgi:hypothetical protein